MSQYLDWKNVSDRDALSRSLLAGAVVGGTSDTVFGLLARASADAKQKLDSIKKRSNMPYLILVPDIQAADRLGMGLEKGTAARLAHELWPGPLTLILRARKDVPEWMQSNEGGIALRVPSHQGLRSLLEKTGPLFSTSANVTGQPIPESVSQMDATIRDQLSDIIVDEKAATTVPSTIVDCTQAPPHIIREGALSAQELQRYFRE